MKTVWVILKIVVIIYVLVCAVLYFLQERLIFFPAKLPAGYRFSFQGNFEEWNLLTKDQTHLNGVLFKADSPRGLIFYLHGNAGSLESWGQIAKTYTDLHYDLLIPDYRGYGKSGGHINSEKKFYEDMQLMYDRAKQQYEEHRIFVLGYSIGTAAAAKLASVNHPHLLILQAPYFNLTDMMRSHFPMVPAFMLKYRFETNVFLSACKMPVVIFHGDNDEVIYYGSSLKLKKLFKPADTLITLNGQAHNGMSDNPAYLVALQQVLSQ
ncbi:MAG: alpha/beta fold hydrolase [Bacteroidota bacterium]